MLYNTLSIKMSFCLFLFSFQCPDTYFGKLSFQAWCLLWLCGMKSSKMPQRKVSLPPSLKERELWIKTDSTCEAWLNLNGWGPHVVGFLALFSLAFFFISGCVVDHYPIFIAAWVITKMLWKKNEILKSGIHWSLPGIKHNILCWLLGFKATLWKHPKNLTLPFKGFRFIYFEA